MRKVTPSSPSTKASDFDAAEEAMIKAVLRVSQITDDVAITNFTSAQNPDIVSEGGFRAILCLDKSLQGDSNLDNRKVAALRVVNLKDGENPIDDFIRAVDSLEDLRRDHNKVLVHCRAGKSRSVAVVAGWLVRYCNYSPADALSHVESQRESAVDAKLKDLVHRLG